MYSLICCSNRIELDAAMIIRWLKISAALFLTLILSVSLTKLIICVWENFQFSSSDEHFDVEQWLQQNQLEQYKEDFRKRGKFSYQFLKVVFTTFIVK